MSQKIIHVFVALLTIIIVFTNFSAKTKAAGLTEKMQKTVMAQLVTDKLADVTMDELIVETVSDSGFTPMAPSKYLDDLALSNQESKITTKTEITEEEDHLDTTSEGDALVKPNIATTNKTVPTRNDVITYTVKPGDSISTIARDFSISVNTILWENNLSSYSLIRPGQDLTILPTTGVRHKVSSGENLSYISNKYDVEISAIAKANDISASTPLKIGQKLMIPGGTKVTVTKVASTPSYSGVSAIKTVLKSSTQAPTNKMLWPTEGARITQYFSWRHTGLDIANKVGTPLYAADAGKITFAGWSTGYGYRIDVDHGGGLVTRYAHSSKLYVKVGDSVERGEQIADMGSTGWSTGPHIHFEVIINGVRQNPLNYIR